VLPTDRLTHSGCVAGSKHGFRILFKCIALHRAKELPRVNSGVDGSNQIVFAEFVRWRFSMGREEGIGVIPSLPFFFVFFNEYVCL